MNIAAVKVGHVGLRGEGPRDRPRAGEREREDGDPAEVDLNSSLRCLVSLLLDKVIRHQVFFIFICYSCVCFCPSEDFQSNRHQTLAPESDRQRSWTHPVFALGVHPGEAQVADGGKGVRRVDHRLGCVAAREERHTWNYTQQQHAILLRWFFARAHMTIFFLKRGQSRVKVSYSPPSPHTCTPYFWES